MNTETRPPDHCPLGLAARGLGRSGPRSVAGPGWSAAIRAALRPRGRRLGFAAAAALLAFGLAAAARLWAPQLVDRPVALALNTFARRSPITDHALQAIAAFDLFQGLPVAALAFGAFAAASARTRVRLAIGITGAGAAAIMSRLLQTVIGGLSRPLVDPALPFRRPYGGDPEFWRDWSSFPSDHATVVWGFAIATLMANRRIGAFCVALATFSSFARLYCGLHYLTDVFAGVFLSMLVICTLLALCASSEQRLTGFASRRPALVATLAFLFSAEAATMFAEVRKVGEAAARNLPT